MIPRYVGRYGDISATYGSYGCRIDVRAWGSPTWAENCQGAGGHEIGAWPAEYDDGTFPTVVVCGLNTSVS